MRNLLITFISILFCTTACAEGLKVFEYPVKNIDLLQTKISIPASLSGEFKQQKTLKDMRVTLNSSGKFAVHKKSFITWHITDPINNLITIKNGEITSETAGKQQSLTSSNQTAKQIMAVLNGIFTQDFKSLSNYFRLYYMEDRTGYTIGLKPSNQIMNEIFSSIIITGNKYVKTAIFINNIGDVTKIDFMNIKEISSEREK